MIRPGRRIVMVKRNHNGIYEEIKSSKELENWMLGKMDDLGYPLRVEPKRDRIILNKQSFMKAFSDAYEEIVKQSQEEIQRWVNEEVNRQIEENTIYLLNHISFNGKEFVAPNHKPKQSDASKLGAYFGRQLMKLAENMWNDMTRLKKGRNR